MMLTWILCAVLAVAAADDCVMSEWGDWTEWTKLGCGEEPSGAVPAHPRKQPHTPAIKEEGRVPCLSGFAGAYQCLNIDQMGSFNFDDICNGFECGHNQDLVGKDVSGYTYTPDPSDPGNFVNYAIMATNWGTSFVQMTGEAELFNADVVAWVETEGFLPASNRDVLVVGEYAYISADLIGHGIQIVNLTAIAQLLPPFVPDGPLNIVTPRAVYTGVGAVNNLVSSPDPTVIYAAGADGVCPGGMMALDISAPLNPAFLGCFQQGSTVIYDASCDTYDGPDDDYTFNGTTTEVCYVFNGNSVLIVNAEDKANMQLISQSSDYPGIAFASQGMVERRDIMLISGDTQDEVDNVDKRTRTFMWDITDLDAPFSDFTYTAEHFAIDAKHMIQEDWVYLANYEAGVRILRIDQTSESLTEIGYFDLHLDDPEFPEVVLYEGANGVFTGFINDIDNGILPVSTVNEGLWLLRADAVYMDQMAEEGVQPSERFRYRTILSGDSASCPNTVDVQTRTIPVECDN